MNQAINVQNLSFAYKLVKVLDNVSFSLEEGSFTGIIGPNGGGKTTLLKLLMGLYKPTSGSIQLFGKSTQNFIGKIGYVPQINMHDPAFPITVQEFVMLGCISDYTIKSGYSKKSKKNAVDAIELLGLSPYLDVAFGKLSGGLAQRALIARSLASDPMILFLDEPTANVDIETKETIYNTLNNLKTKKTILMVTHDLNTVVKYVDSVISVEKKITTYLPEKICEHFSLGLYHTPLIK
jgi:zinc transport system ATP-binding protein